MDSRIPYDVVNRNLEEKLNSFQKLYHIENERWFLLGYIFGVTFPYTYYSEEYQNTISFARRFELFPSERGEWDGPNSVIRRFRKLFNQD